MACIDIPLRIIFKANITVDSSNLIYLFDDNIGRSFVFWWGPKNKEHFYNLVFINFWVKSELRGFLQSRKLLDIKEERKNLSIEDETGIEIKSVF